MSAGTSDAGAPPAGAGAHATVITPAPRPEAAERVYLLIFEGDSSSVFALPPAGAAVVGRGAGADLELHSLGVSRRHALLSLESGEATIEDLGSQNGTFVNGERLAGIRTLLSQDVISICDASLVFHAGARVHARARQVDMGTFRLLVDEELERANAYGRPFALLAVGPVERAVQPAASEAMAGRHRNIERMTYGGEQAYVLLPETAAAEAALAAAELLAAVQPLSPQARVGVAACPRDGCELDTLLASARSALDAAAAGAVVSAERAFRSLAVGERTVLIADQAMERLYALIERLAGGDLPVLVVRRDRHRQGPRRLGGARLLGPARGAPS